MVPFLLPTAYCLLPILTHFPPAFDDSTAAAMNATPRAPSSTVGKRLSGSGLPPSRAARMARATSA